MNRSCPPFPLGVVIVTFNSTDVILDCLESLLNARDVTLHIVVVDNASTDGTVEAIRVWAEGTQSYCAPASLPFPLNPVPKPVPLRNVDQAGPGITLIEAGINGGFAAGVNLGLAHLARQPKIDRFWILNPDTVVPPDTPNHFASWSAASESFALMGSRINYLFPPDRIQSDGGWINWLTGVNGNINLGRSSATPPPPVDYPRDYIAGASMVTSRNYYETAGPLPEEYFLYYEEIAWAQRRGDLPLIHCPEALVYHQAGTSIGSPTVDRIASPFSIYFLYRSRMLFLRRHRPAALPAAYLYALIKAGQILLKRRPQAAHALLAALYGLDPPRHVREKLSPEAAHRIFGKV